MVLQVSYDYSSLVGMMIDFLELNGKHNVLEIGTGSSYNALIIGYILKELKGGNLTTVEIVDPLASQARAIVQKSKVSDVVTVINGDATRLKYPRKFDRIIATANFGKKELLDKIRENLAVGGIFVYSASDSVFATNRSLRRSNNPSSSQYLIKEKKVIGNNGKTRIYRERLMPVRFVPITQR